MSSLFQSLTENEVGNGCCLFNVEEDRTDAVRSWGVFMVPTCPLKDSLRCTQTPWVISVSLALLRVILSQREAAFVCMAPPGFPAQQGSGACACPGSRMLSAAVADSSPYLLLALAL